MNILFSMYVNKHCNLNELRNKVVFESKKIAVQVADKIRSGFASFLKFISNSAVALKKMFSFSNVIENIEITKKNFPENVKAAPSVIVDNKITRGDKSAELIFNNNFEELKSKMHAELNFLMGKRTMSNNIG